MELILPVPGGMSLPWLSVVFKVIPSPQLFNVVADSLGGSSRMVFILPVNIERLGERGLLSILFSFLATLKENMF